MGPAPGKKETLEPSADRRATPRTPGARPARIPSSRPTAERFVCSCLRQRPCGPLIEPGRSGRSASLRMPHPPSNHRQHGQRHQQTGSGHDAPAMKVQWIVEGDVWDHRVRNQDRRRSSRPIPGPPPPQPKLRHAVAPAGAVVRSDQAVPAPSCPHDVDAGDGGRHLDRVAGELALVDEHAGGNKRPDEERADEHGRWWSGIAAPCAGAADAGIEIHLLSLAPRHAAAPRNADRAS